MNFVKKLKFYTHVQEAVYHSIQTDAAVATFQNHSWEATTPKISFTKISLNIAIKKKISEQK